MKYYDHFIDGSFYPAKHGETIESINPATGICWARFARGNQDDVDLAIKAAHHAYMAGQWSGYTAQERADCLISLADVVEQRWPELVEAEVNDNGKRISEVNGQFAGLHSWYRYFAEQILQVKPHPLANQIIGVRNTAHYVPYGVIGVITPWNSPLMILAWKIAPALAAGNTVVIKPSEFASASTLEFARLSKSSTIPDGVINVVTGTGSEAGEPVVKHALTRKVTFTGSDVGGSKVAEAAAGGVIPTTLELGGKSAQLLFDDVDIDNALNGVISGIFLSNGQTCVAGSRLIVADSIHDQVVSKIVERAKGLKAGNPLKLETQIAPLANKIHLHKVLDMINQAKSQGAECVCGGIRQYPQECPDGFYVEPTIFTNVTSDMNLWHEEVFGPVLAITRFNSEAEAISLANDSKYGLAAGIWTNNVERGQRVARQIHAGTVYINHYRSVDPASPVGGFKKSGYGRELGPDAVKEFLQLKSIWLGETPCADPFPNH